MTILRASKNVRGPHKGVRQGGGGGHVIGDAMIQFLPFSKFSYTKLPFTNISYTKLPASTEKNLSLAMP